MYAMSLIDKLRPSRRPVGKVVDCPRCGTPGAEYVTANMTTCPKCDAPGGHEDDAVWIDLDDAETRVTYRCITCSSERLYVPIAVARGQRCAVQHFSLNPCGGMLFVVR
jgi:hypothetical protein